MQAHPGYREQPRRHEHGDHPRKTPQGLERPIAVIALLQVLHHGFGRGGGLVAGQPIQPLLDFFGAGLAEDAGYHAVFGVEEGGSRRSAWTFWPLASRNVRAALGASAHGASTDTSAVRGTSRTISPCAPWQAGGRCSSAAKRNRRTRRGHARRVSCRERRGCGRGRPAAEESCPTPLPGWME